MHYSEIFEGVNDHYLYHGTDLLSAMSILKHNSIDQSSQYDHNPIGVSLTRDYKVAHEFGTMWDRNYPVVFVIDAKKLKQSRLRVFPRLDSDSPGQYRDRGEAEEMVLGNIEPLDQYLVSINVKPLDLKRAITDMEWAEYAVENGFSKSRRSLIASVKDFLKSPLINNIRPRLADYLDREPSYPPVGPQFQRYRRGGGMEPAVVNDEGGSIHFTDSEGKTTIVGISGKTKTITVVNMPHCGEGGLLSLREMKTAAPLYRIVLLRNPRYGLCWSEDEIREMISNKIIDSVVTR